MTTFHGEFFPPDMGRTTVPIAIIGKGSIELGTDALGVKGIKRKGATGMIVLLVFASIALMFGCGILFNQLGWQGKSSAKIAAFTGLLAGFGGLSVIRKRQKAGSSEPLELSFPWKQVKKVAFDVDAPNVVVIHVKRSLLNTESLHFGPQDKANDVIAAVKERLPA